MKELSPLYRPRHLSRCRSKSAVTETSISSRVQTPNKIYIPATRVCGLCACFKDEAAAKVEGMRMV